VTGLFLAGWGLRCLATAPGSLAHPGGPAWRLDSRSLGAGQGVLAGLLGGFRPVTADLVWMRMTDAWTKQDAAATETWLELVTVIDPESLQFWLHGARIIAYDLPEWRINAAGGRGIVPRGVQQRIVREQAGRALARLDEAMKVHPARAALWIERATIELSQLGDLSAAAESYRRAGELADAPFFAARLHAELLRRLGKPQAALAWLAELHPRLPATDEAAAAGLVLARIRALERELKIPAERAYRVRVGGGGH